MAISEERSAGGWRSSPVVWGGLFVLAAVFVAVGVYALVDGRDVWVWDVVKAAAAAVVALSAGIELRRRGLRRR